MLYDIIHNFGGWQHLFMEKNSVKTKKNPKKALRAALNWNVKWLLYIFFFYRFSTLQECKQTCTVNKISQTKLESGAVCQQPLGKKHALKEYDKFSLNNSRIKYCPSAVVQFHEIFVTKIMNKLDNLLLLLKQKFNCTIENEVILFDNNKNFVKSEFKNS